MKSESSGYPGTNKLANVLSRRMKRENNTPLALDFGEIQLNGSLITNTFPVPIPRGDYSICRYLNSIFLETEECEDHTHVVKLPAVCAGDRVLVAWVQNEAVVIDVITRS